MRYFFGHSLVLRPFGNAPNRPTQKESNKYSISALNLPCISFCLLSHLRDSIRFFIACMMRTIGKQLWYSTKQFQAASIVWVREHISKSEYSDVKWGAFGNTLGTWGACWELSGNLIGTHWEEQKIPHPPPPFLPKRKKTGPLGACWLTTLAAKNFYAYLYSLPLHWIIAGAQNCEK